MTERSEAYRACEQEEFALNLLCTWPGMFDKIEDCLRWDEADTWTPCTGVHWDQVAVLAVTSGYSGRERAFLGVCAELAGYPVPHVAGESFVTRFTNLGAATQHIVARALTRIADDTNAREQAARQVFGQ